MNLYLFSGYAVFWIIVFLYVVYLHRKQQKLSVELQSLASHLKDEEERETTGLE